MCLKIRKGCAGGAAICVCGSDIPYIDKMSPEDSNTRIF